MTSVTSVESELVVYSTHLEISEDDVCVFVKPKHFIPKPVFIVINKKIFALGGEYVSKGQESHWIIWKHKRRRNCKHKPEETFVATMRKNDFVRCPHCGIKIKVVMEND